MTRYNLDGLGADTFEDMVLSLSLGVIGPGVTAFGAGPDGGREATYRGPINWSKTVLDQGSSWDGYCVIQAKYRAEPASKPTENAAWLRRMIDKELDDWADEGGRRDEIPKYIIFATNIELSSVPNTGGLDALAAHINKGSSRGGSRDPISTSGRSGTDHRLRPCSTTTRVSERRTQHC